MDLRDKIIEFLRQHPSKKAREIADALGEERSAVNSCLYRERGRTFEQLAGYRWQLRAAKSARRDSPKEAAPLDTPVAKLSRYYLACLSRDLDRDLSEFAVSKYGAPNYAELTALPMIANDDDAVWGDPDAQRIIGRFRKEFRKLSLFVGYPTRVALLRARSGWQGFMIEPLLVFEYRLDGGRGAPTLVDDRPEINMRALRGLTGSQGPDLLDEAILLREELQLDAVGFSAEDVEDACCALREIRPDWDWREPLDPATLSSNGALSEVSEEGTYNRAVLITAERSPFTQGLETELRALEKLSPTDYANTALGSWCSTKPGPAQAAESDDALLEVLPLNTEQREAVRRSLSRPLTVITGPPGTGKSQVVTSILVNCAWRGIRVLFASKNHKAVDVVETRVNAIGPRPILLRLGTNEIQTRLAEYLTSLLAATTEPHEAEEYEQAVAGQRDLLARRTALLTDLALVVKSRNHVDSVEQEVEQYRAAYGMDWFGDARSLDVSGHQAVVNQAEAAIERATRDRQSFFTRLTWLFLERGRVSAATAAVSELGSVAEAMRMRTPPQETDGADVRTLKGFVNAVRERLTASREVAAYYESLDALSACCPPEALAARFMELDAELSSVCAELWQLWLRLQPARLSSSDRGLLADYKAALEMINRTRERNARPTSQLYKRFYELFPRLTSVLPAWAVTNLSARGRIPLAPGFFDLLIVDEASQCDIASVLPLLYRCKRAVIIGDPKQLKHITKLDVRSNEELMEKHGVFDLGERWSYAGNSLFDLAASLTESGDVISLRDHHRSRAEIIGFSNRYFYEERLRVATRYDVLRVPHAQPALRWLNVTGVVRRPSSGGAVNSAEANAVVHELSRLLVQQRYDGTVGVVTPFRAQANRIRDLVSQDDGLMAALGRSELLIETAYKFQGDERDVMLFSPVVSVETPRTALGFLRGNPNTFNVAITRARAALIVVGDHAVCSQSEVEHLAAFAQYVLDHDKTGEASPPLTQDLGPRYPAVANPERVSEWEHFFYQRLYEEGVRPIPQYAVEQYVLDFPIVEGDRRLNVEIDGERYHRAWNGELAMRDQIRNRRLLELGWDVMRFWVYQVRDDTVKCLARVTKWQEAAAQDASSLGPAADCAGVPDPPISGEKPGSFD